MLVRYNPDGDAELNRRQAGRLATPSSWLGANGRRFLFELLVPATVEQSEPLGGDRDAYDRDLRPQLVVRTLAALQDAGVEPDVWKIEGLETRADCERAVAQARAAGRDEVACVVLGRGAGLDRSRTGCARPHRSTATDDRPLRERRRAVIPAGALRPA